MAVNVGTAYINVLPETRGFGAALASGLRSAGGAISSVGASLTRKLTLPIVGAGAAAVKLSTDFQTSMQKIVALVGVSQRQVGAWSDEILSLSRTLPIGPQELADALYFVASAGIPVKDAMNVVKVSAKAAAAGLGDTATIADLVTSAINAYGPKAISAGKATDILVNAVKLGKGEAVDFASSLGRVIPIAQTVGVSFDQVSAAVAGLTLTGLSVPEAVTAIRGVLTAIIKPGKDAKKALQEVGLSIEGLRNEIAKKGLFAALVDLRTRIGDNKDILGRIIPNIRALTGFLSLTGKNAGNNARIFKELANSTGLTDQAFQAMSETAGFKMKQALSSLKATAIQFGDVLLPVVAKAAGFFGKLFDAIGRLSPHAKTLVVTILAIAAAIGPVLFIVGHLISGFALLASPLGIVVGILVGAGIIIYKNWSKVAPVFEAVGRFLGNLMTQMKNLFKVFTSGDDVAQGFGEIMDNIFGNTGKLVPVFRALAMGVQRFGSFLINTVVPAALSFGKTLATSLWPIIKQLAMFVAQTLIPAIASIAQTLVTNVIPVVVSVVTWFAKLWEQIQPTVLDILHTAIAAVVKIIQTLVPILKSWWDKLAPVRQLIANLIPVVLTLAKWLLKLVAVVLPPLLKILGKVIGIAFSLIGVLAKVVLWVGGLVPKAFGLLMKGVHLVLRAWDAVKSGTITAWNAVVDFLKRVPGRIAAFFSGAWDKIRSGLETAWGAIVRFFQAIPGRIAAFFRALPQAIAFAIALIPGILIGVAILGFKLMFIAAKAGWEALLAGIRTIPGLILGALKGLGSLLLDLGRALIRGLWNGAKAVWALAYAFFVTIPSLILRGLAALPGLLLRSGRALIQGLWNGARAVWASVSGWVRSLPGLTLRALGSLASTLVSHGRDLIRGLWNGAKAIWSSVSSWVAGLPDRILSALGSLAGILFNAGRAVITGLWDGMKSAIGAVFGWVKGIAGSIASLKGPLPKDRKLLVPAGVAIMTGLREGLESQFGPLADTLGKVTGMITGLPTKLPPGVASFTPPAFTSGLDPSGTYERTILPMSRQGTRLMGGTPTPASGAHGLPFISNFNVTQAQATAPEIINELEWYWRTHRG